MRTLLLALALCLVGSGVARSEPISAETVRDPSPRSADGTIARMFKAGLAGDWAAYLKLVHPDLKRTDKQRRARQRREWRRFQQRAAWYLVSRRPISFVVASRRADANHYVRIFLQDQKNKDRLPAPVRLRQDQGRWYLVTNSL